MGIAITSWLLRSSLPGGLIGLALTWSFNCTASFQFFTNLSTQCEAKLTSIERIVYYAGGKSTVGAEAASLTTPRQMEDARRALEAWKEAHGIAGVSKDGTPLLPNKEPSSSSSSALSPAYLARHWPVAGEVVFHEVSLRYRPDLPPALRSVPFRVKEVGRAHLLRQCFDSVNHVTDLFTLMVSPWETSASRMSVGPRMACVSSHKTQSYSVVLSVTTSLPLISTRMRRCGEPWSWLI